jgi:hypothetical protein
MTGILFLLDVMAFVVVAWWAYVRCGPRAESPETGLLAMRPGDSREPRPKGPTWKAPAPQLRDPRPDPEEGRRVSRSEPRWKASRPRPRPPA